MSVLHTPMRFPPAPTLIFVSAVILLMTGCASLVPSPSPGVALYDPVPKSIETGKASYYGGRWIGRLTANGERYHSMVRVTNLRNNKSVIVRINNRGPYAKGRILDLSIVAAKKIEMIGDGIVPVRAEVLKKIPVLTKPNRQLSEVQ